MTDTPHNDSIAYMAIARQPIIDAKRTIQGYELFDRSQRTQSFTAASDAALLFNLLSNSDQEAVQTRTPFFINCTHQTLAGGHLELIEPARLVLEIPPMEDESDADTIEAYEATLTEVRKRGFRLAFDADVLRPAYASWLPMADFIKFDISQIGNTALAQALKRHTANSRAQLVAERIETAEQFDQARMLGATLFQGYWFAKPVLIKGQTIRPAQANILQLINLVRKQAEIDDIEEVFKRDPTLSFNLLRFINSAGFGLRTEITSFRHAVMMLGLKKLFRWAALLMTTSASANGSPALGNAAVVRGRLMELLASEKLPPDELDNAFVVGIFSLLDAMLGLPLDEALASLSLPTSVTAALLQDSGPLAPFLRLTLACEQADEATFAIEAQTTGLSGDQINWAHLNALAWAENLGNT